MSTVPRPIRLAAIFGSITLLGGCTPPSALRNFDGDPWVKRNAEALDRMGTLLNEYGTVGMSAPLIMIPDKSFEFDLPEQGPKEYFEDAKSDIQAHAAAVELDVSLLGLNVSATIDPVKRAAAAANIAAARLRLNTALKAAEQLEDPKQRADAQAKAGEDYAAALKASTGDAPAAQGAQGDASKGATQAQNVIPEAYKKFLEPGKLLGTNPAVTSTNRSALIVSAGDTAVEGILRAMHSPTTPSGLLGKQKLFATAMVSVTPGWHTRSDFAARLTIRPTLRFEPARAEVNRHVLGDLRKGDGTVSNCGQLRDSATDSVKYHFADSNAIAPAAISAVSPMTDTQRLQLSNSQRQRKERALQLALALQSAGLDAGAKLFYEHLKDLEKDVLTDNREVPITAFATGHQFGYEIGPELWAQTDPSASKPTPGYRLVRQSFPTLILLGFEDEELRPRLKCDAERPNATPTVVEPHLYIQQTRRWIPLTERAAASGPIDGEIAALNDQITRAYLSSQACKDKSVAPNVCDQINARGNALAEELMGNNQQQPLPLCMVVPDLPRCTAERLKEARQQAEADQQKQKPAQAAAAPAGDAAKPAPAKANAAKAAPTAKK